VPSVDKQLIRMGVVIVEPVGVVRASLQMVFEAEPDFDVLGVADQPQPGLEVVSQARGHANTVVLVGLEFAGERDSFWLIRAIRDRSPELIILATGTDLNRGAISQGLFMGADGFIHKNSTPERYVGAARRAAAGELVLEGLPRGALGEIVEDMHTRHSSAPVLTDREQMVLATAAEGFTAREIGRRLGVSERTVTTHLNNIYRKLGANGRVSALSAAMRIGVLTLPEAQGRATIAVS
jgi:DNA-binding NarL/FixJ family response regulator